VEGMAQEWWLRRQVEVQLRMPHAWRARLNYAAVIVTHASKFFMCATHFCSEVKCHVHAQQQERNEERLLMCIHDGGMSYEQAQAAC